jgi:uncharacterized membrane protein YccC
VVRADFPLPEIELLLAQLGQLQTDLVETLQIPPPNEWIELYLFHDRASYEKFLARYFPRLRQVLVEYLADLRTANAGEPLSRHLRRRMPAAEASLAAHFKSWKR